MTKTAHHESDGNSDSASEAFRDAGAIPPPRNVPLPVRVALYSMQGLAAATVPSRRRFDLDEFARMLNDLQGSFYFEACDTKWSFDTYEAVHLYTNEQYYDRLLPALVERRSDCAIAITVEDLEKSVFNVHRETDSIGIVTVSRYQEYVPPGGTLEQYLAFLILCEVFCLAGKWQFEHARHEKCLFDMCASKSELLPCLSLPSIDARCEQELRRAGFVDEHIDDAYKILSYVGTPRWSKIALSSIREPGAGFLLGIATTLGSAILLTVSVTVAEALFAVSALFWLGTLWVTAVKGRPKRPQRGHAGRGAKLGERVSK